MNPRRLGLLVASLVCLPPVAAYAQSGADFAVRRDLLQQAQQARDAHDDVRALELATRAGALQMTPSVRMFIAQEEFATSHFAEALNNAELCARESTNEAVMNHEAIHRVCADVANQSRGRVGRVVLRVPAPAVPGLQVRVNGHEVPVALLGFPYIVTPGVVVIETVAPGHQDRRTEVTVAVGANLDVSVSVGENSVVPTAAVASVTPTPTPSPSPRAWTTRRVRPIVGPVVVAAGGVLSLGAAVAFGVLRGNAITTLNGMCDAPVNGVQQCDQGARGSFNDATTDSIVADVTLGVGIAALAVGAAWLLAGGHDERVPQASLMVSPTAGGAMFGVGGVL